MKIAALSLAVAALAGLPTVAAAAGPVLVDFEKNWDYLAGSIDGYYAGGTAADGSSGPNLGLSFVNVSGLSNDAAFTYYSNAPSPLGVAYVYDTAFINLVGETAATGALSFAYSSPSAITGAIRAFSGLDGTGTLLGSFDLAANAPNAYDTWSVASFAFAGLARSFELSSQASVAAFDDVGLNVVAVPEPSTVLMMLVGGAVAFGATRKRRRA